MKITVKNSALNNAVNTAVIAVGSGDESKIMTHFMVRLVVATGLVELLAQDGQRLTVSAPIVDAVASNTDDATMFSVPAWRLKKWLSSLDDPDEELTLELLDGVVKASSTRGSGKMGSLDPKDWPFWDQTQASAVESVTVSASRLSGMLSYSRAFVSDMETKSPALCSVQSRDGKLWASDSVGLSEIRSDALGKSNFRIHGKDVSSVLSFLSSIGEADVKLLEHDRCVYFSRPDGAVLGVTKPIHDFPVLNLPSGASKCFFEVKKADFLGAVKFLDAFARKDDLNLHFRFEDDNLILSMRSGSGSAEDDEQTISLVSSRDIEEFDKLQKKEFILSKEYLNIVASMFDQDTVKFQLDWKGKSGWVRFDYERNSDAYCTLVLWVKNA